MHGIVVQIFHVRTCWSAGFCSSSWHPGRFQRARVCWVLAWWSLWDTEAREKTERNNAGELEPGYSAQFDAAPASAATFNRHEQEKSIRLTRLLSKGLLLWERVEGIKAFEDGGKQKGESAPKESKLEWQVVVLFVGSASSDPEITFFPSVFTLDVLKIQDTFPYSFFYTAVVWSFTVLSGYWWETKNSF